MKNNYKIDKIISFLEIKKNEVIEELKCGENEMALLLKKQLDTSINCLKLCEKYQIFDKQIKKIIELPENTSEYSGLFSEYRIFNDMETEDQKHWKELKTDNFPLRLIAGDLIIIKN